MSFLEATKEQLRRKLEWERINALFLAYGEEAAKEINEIYDKAIADLKIPEEPPSK